MNHVHIRNLILGEGIPKICVPLTASSEEELIAQAALLPSSPADLAEWRADCMEGIFESETLLPLLARLRETLGDLPLLFTFRTRKEGGNQDGSAAQYFDLVSRAITSGLIDLADIELMTGDGIPEKLQALAKKHHVASVFSNHDFYTTPPANELVKRLKMMEQMGADIAKIAVMPRYPEDVITLLSASVRAHQLLSCPVAAISMGKTGLASRLCGESFGSCLTFGTVGAASAPGQISAAELRQVLNTIHNQVR